MTNLTTGRQSDRISHDVTSDGAHETVRNVTQFLGRLRQLYVRLFNAALPTFVLQQGGFNGSRGTGERGWYEICFSSGNQPRTVMY